MIAEGGISPLSRLYSVDDRRKFAANGRGASPRNREDLAEAPTSGARQARARRWIIDWASGAQRWPVFLSASIEKMPRMRAINPPTRSQPFRSSDHLAILLASEMPTNQAAACISPKDSHRRKPQSPRSKIPHRGSVEHSGCP